MTRLTLTGVVTGLVILVTALPAPAAEGKTHPCIVLVGISKYADEQILPRANAENDVKALYDVFTSKDYLGISPKNVRLLLGSADSKRPSEIANRQNILEALRWATANAGSQDLVVLAFMIQGAPLGERSCYFATDSTFKDRAKNAVGASDIEKALADLKSRRVCAFVDVNFKGFNPGKGSVPELHMTSSYKEFMGAAKEDEGMAPGRVLFLANNGSKPTLQHDKHSVFAEAVLTGLKGAADKEGYEPDGVVTVDELADYLKKEIPSLARKYGKTDEEKEQRLFVFRGRDSHFELTNNPAVAAKVRERLEKFERLPLEKTVDNALAKEIAEEGRKLLSRMPKLEAYRTLRKEYQQLADGTLELDQFVKDRAGILADLKIERSTATTFAAKVIHATQLIHNEYVKEIKQGDLVVSAIKGLYGRIEEKVPEDIKERMDKAKTMKEEELTNLLADARQQLGKREDLANHKDLDYALQRMMSPLDPYTTYIDPERLAQFKREMGSKFTGIGVQIRPDAARDRLTVVTPILGSPAYKAGMKAGDVITQIKREYDSQGKKLDKPEVISTKGLPIEEAVKKIVGKAGTNVKLTVEREGVDKPIEFELTRGTVEPETVLGYKRQDDDSWDYVIDPDYQICYVRLTQFASYTERDLLRVLDKLRKKPGIKGFVLDLRFNPGGLLTSAVNICDTFIDGGLIVTIRPRVGHETPYLKERELSLTDFPMVCLVNGHSASGSEIVSACLQDHDRAVVVGQRSYGKGSVQNIQPFEDGELKLTTASFWRPSNKNLNRSSTKGRDDDEWGVRPNKGFEAKLSPKEQDELEAHLRKMEIIPRRDLPVKEKDKNKPEFQDTQLDVALRYLREQIKLGQRVSKKAG